MFIQTESTPNPATLKFLPGRQVLGDGTANFADRASADRSPLAGKLFEIAGITGVFLGRDFISVTKDDEADWYALKPPVLAAIMDAYAAGTLIASDAPVPAPSDAAEDSEIVSQIKELIDTRVRPAVEQDGGDIIYRGFEDGIVLLHMQGACAGCPSSTATLRNGIENLLKHYVPEVLGVRAVEAWD